MKNKKILITGVLGVLGSPLEKRLLEMGYQVFGIDLFNTDRNYGHKLGDIGNENYFRCDISSYRLLEYVFDYVKPDLVYNAAANFGRWCGEMYYEDVWTSNVIGLKNILRLQEKMGFKLVHFSSSEVYGDYEGIMYEDLLSEKPIPQLNDYALSKRVNEQQIKNSQIQFDTKSVIIRIFNTYSNGEIFSPYRSVNCNFCYNLLHNRPITVFKGHLRTSTYIDDAIDAIANIPSNFHNGEIYNIASQQLHTIETLAELVLQYTGADPNLVKYVDHNEILTTKIKQPCNKKSIRDLGFKETVSLEEGVRRTVEWMKEYYKIK